MSRKPEYILKCSRKDKSNSKFGKIGAGWVNDSGTISVVLDVGVALHWKDMDTLSVILAPVDDNPNSKGQ
jgi:hypothetical protein